MPPAKSSIPHVAYLTGEYPAVSHTFILREIAALRDQGYDVTPCSIRTTGPEHRRGTSEAAEAARTFYVIKAAKNPLTFLAAQGAALARPKCWFSAARLAWRTRPPGLRALVWQLFYLAEAAVLARHLKAEGVTHLHNHFANSSCSVAMLTGVLADVPFSFTLHGPSIFFEPHWWRIDEKIARARFVACISHFCRSQGMIFADPAHWAKMHIVHCGVDPEHYAGAGPPGGKQLIFVGRLAAVKGVLVLLQAFAAAREAHPDATLTLVGDGPERAQIAAHATELGLQDAVRFTGYLTQEDVTAELSRADLFVLPSFAEGVPVVLMEAMASGRPVIATRIAGIPELVEDGESGLLVPPGDASALANAITALLHDPARRTAMGEAGQARVAAEFDQAQEVAWLARLIRRQDGGALHPEGQDT